MTKQKQLLPLTNDMVFHAVYGRDTEESKQALIALLNAILERTDDPITDLVYLNPISWPSVPTEKAPILDIKVETSSGILIDIEIQVIVKGIFRNRSVYYGAKMLADSLEKGENYAKMKQTIVISIMDEILFPETDRCHTVFRFMEQSEGFELSSILSLHYLELSKIDIAKPISKMTSVERLGAYIKYASDASKADYVEKLLSQKEGAVQMANTLLRKVSADDIFRERLEAEKRRQYDINTINTLLEEAQASGMTAGRAEFLSIYVRDLLSAHCTESEIIGKLTTLYSMETSEAESLVKAIVQEA